MPEDNPVFLVDPYSTPVAVRIAGRASFQNVVPLKEFLKNSYASGKRDFVFDFSQCAGMDSTVLGVLAGCALELRRLEPKGSLVLSRLNDRNLELVKNLGLHRIATVDTGDDKVASGVGATTALNSKQLNELENARLCLEAHENLVAADSGNQEKFQDVIAYLKNRVEDEA
ncbi:STAS domain-containing protein [Pelagicoccus sp. SDUM812002]|uniref:STAS domain-containing protein n=1 Tax=Pelagicoccus sp. SDUM812002 TaxID=3041266 RepID=UPI002810352C|nr:STAS domain-containing protein [Pelagicoccus sp. SDUM812002]MDQ8184839.1 STAS domain-containing protein [Pelagicoccus sp. SDUM812002]